MTAGGRRWLPGWTQECIGDCGRLPEQACSVLQEEHHGKGPGEIFLVLPATWLCVAEHLCALISVMRSR